MTKLRAKGMGSIFKRGKYYYLQTRINGKAKLISLKGGSKNAISANPGAAFSFSS